MASNVPSDFDSLSLDEKIDHVQSLWARVAREPEGLPTPDWHLDIVRERLDSHQNDEDTSVDWQTAYSELRKRL